MVTSVIWPQAAKCEMTGWNANTESPRKCSQFALISIFLFYLLSTVYTAATLYCCWQGTCSIYCTPLYLYCTSVWVAEHADSPMQQLYCQQRKWPIISLINFWQRLARVGSCNFHSDPVYIYSTLWSVCPVNGPGVGSVNMGGVMQKGP